MTLKRPLRKEIRGNKLDFLDKINPGIDLIHPYEPGKSVSDVVKKYQLEKIIKLSSNENTRGPSLKVVRTIKNFNDWHVYPDGDGQELKEKIATIENIEPDKVVLGNGSNEVLELLGQTFLSPQVEAIFSAHAFAVYKLISQARGSFYHEIPTLNWGHDLESFLKKINDKTRLIFIANPNNPTGTYSSHDEIIKFLRKVPAHVMVVIDLAYYEYVTVKDYIRPIEIIKNFPNVVITKSFSKIYGLSNLRIGYGLGTKELIEILNRIRQPFNVNGLAQAAAATAITDRSHIEVSIKNNVEGRNFLYQALTDLNIEFIPSQGNFVCIETKTNGSYVFNALLKEGVIVRSLDLYSMPKHIRVSIGSGSENRFFINKLKKVISTN